MIFRLRITWARQLCTPCHSNPTPAEQSLIACSRNHLEYPYDPKTPARLPLFAEVAEAIFESVLPRQAGDVLPSSPAGLLVSVADK